MATAPVQNVSVRMPKVPDVQLTIPDGSFESDHFSAVSGKELVASKVHHRHYCTTAFGLEIDDTPVAKEFVIYVARGAETISKFAALLVDTGTSTDVDFVLKKNGSTLMSSDLTITHAESDGEVLDGTGSLSSLALVADDILSIATVVNSSTGAVGPFAWVEIDSVGE